MRSSFHARGDGRFRPSLVRGERRLDITLLRELRVVGLDSPPEVHDVGLVDASHLFRGRTLRGFDIEGFERRRRRDFLVPVRKRSLPEGHAFGTTRDDLDRKSVV